jgi:CubicO group peptidase (beta-lactamase class C family)
MSEITMPEEVSAELLLSWVQDRSAREMATQNVPGLAIGVHFQGESVSAGVGAADLRGKTPVSSASTFRWCSITKPFTATLALALMTKGLIDLDEPVVSRLPTLTLADNAALERLSMRHLLTHTTGFECELDCDLEGFGEGQDALANAVAAFGRLTQWTAPGSCWGYCNSGYWLAAHLCSLANRSTYEEAMNEHVLSPLGLRATGFEAQGAGARVLATAYGKHESDPMTVVEVPARTFPRCRRGSGGLVGPVDDLMRFAAVHLHPDTSPWGSSVLQLQSVQATVNKDERQLLGWYSRRTSEGWTVEHDGSWGGFESQQGLCHRSPQQQEWGRRGPEVRY